MTRLRGFAWHRLATVLACWLALGSVLPAAQAAGSAWRAMLRDAGVLCEGGGHSGDGAPTASLHCLACAAASCCAAAPPPAPQGRPAAAHSARAGVATARQAQAGIAPLLLPPARAPPAQARAFPTLQALRAGAA